jgi:hypothetical protein
MRPKELVRRWVEASTEEMRMSGPTSTPKMRPIIRWRRQRFSGREAIRSMFAREFAAAEMVCIPESIFEDGEWAILEWRDPVGLRGCGFFHVQNDQIVCQRGYWDKLSFLRLHQLPVPEP